MSRVQRDSVAGRVYLDLQSLARRTGRPTDELLHMFALEGFLDRLSGSGLQDRFVLKGGMLLAAFATRRPTRDVDLAALRLDGDQGTILEVIRRVAAAECDDGLEFDVAGASAAAIRDEDEHSGVRVTVPARLARAVLRFHIDVNFGDPISPPPGLVALPRILGGDPVRVLGYPLVMVLAEKLVTMVERGVANTRWRDLADVYLLCRSHDLDGEELLVSITVVAGHRGVDPVPLVDVLVGFPDLAQPRWTAWRRKQGLDDVLPEDLTEVLRAASNWCIRDPVRRLGWDRLAS